MENPAIEARVYQVGKRYDPVREPEGVSLPENSFTREVIARLIRITAGNFRLLARLLTQLERVLNVNDLNTVTLEIVDAARDSLVIGQA
jgi:hypothetical protein